MRNTFFHNQNGQRAPKKGSRIVSEAPICFTECTVSEMCIGKTQCKTRFFMSKIVLKKNVAFGGGGWAKKLIAKKGASVLEPFLIILAFILCCFSHLFFNMVPGPFWHNFGSPLDIILLSFLSFFEGFCRTRFRTRFSYFSYHLPKAKNNDFLDRGLGNHVFEVHKKGHKDDLKRI